MRFFLQKKKKKEKKKEKRRKEKTFAVSYAYWMKGKRQRAIVARGLLAWTVLRR